MLDLESTNVKALYRRAQAYMQLTDLDLAELDIKKALDIDPNNRYVIWINYCFWPLWTIWDLLRSVALIFGDLSFILPCNVIVLYAWTRDVKLEYRTLKEKVKANNRKEAQFYGNMINKMTKIGSW